MKNNKQSAMNTNHCVQTDVGATQHRIYTQVHEMSFNNQLGKAKCFEYYLYSNLTEFIHDSKADFVVLMQYNPSKHGT